MTRRRAGRAGRDDDPLAAWLNRAVLAAPGEQRDALARRLGVGAVQVARARREESERATRRNGLLARLTRDGAIQGVGVEGGGPVVREPR